MKTLLQMTNSVPFLWQRYDFLNKFTIKQYYADDIGPYMKGDRTKYSCTASENTFQHLSSILCSNMCATLCAVLCVVGVQLECLVLMHHVAVSRTVLF